MTAPIPHEPPALTIPARLVPVLAEAVAICVSQRIKNLQINGLVPTGQRIHRHDPGLADLADLIDTVPQLGARCSWRWRLPARPTEGGRP